MTGCVSSTQNTSTYSSAKSSSFRLYSDLYTEEKKLPTAKEIIEKNIVAIGGSDALIDTQNMKKEGVYTISLNRKYPMLKGDVVIYMEKPYKHRENYMNHDIPNHLSRVGSDGRIVWNIDHFRGPRLIEGEERVNMLLSYQFCEPVVMKEQFQHIKTITIEEINGRACYKVLFNHKEGSPWVAYYYDIKNFMLLKTDEESPNIKIETLYSDYKKVGRLVFPHKLNINKKINAESLYYVLTFNKIETNIQMPEGIFDLPEEIKALIKNKNNGDRTLFNNDF